ncbi:MAG: protein-L-isoaspartate(D-aspartate) O-methyltransferase [Candidatus Tokpelaia sp. JSC161]|nr:MAG: protein-L-isoaspartate(D-aspartate) O-methyltransferase [Candidatus Tokpelaia sp. JSC161]
MAVNFLDMRKKMLDNQIRTFGVTQYSILSAFLSIPREDFLPLNLRSLAYTDEHLLLDECDFRFSMAPAPLAKLIQLANIQKEDCVLDIGSNIGYAAAILGYISKSVTAIESEQALVLLAEKNLSPDVYRNVSLVMGALELGYIKQAPYDVILIEGSVDFIPEILFEQMGDGGRLVAVEGQGNAGKANIYLRKDDAISVQYCFNLAVKPLPNFLKKDFFTF